MFSIDDLNKTQLEIALDTFGAILVTAGAGSGKTRLLTHRICYLINNEHINPSNILAITFTNKATNEMKERIAEMLPNSNGIWISTFHAMCVKILRANIDKIDGYTKYFTIIDSSDQDKLIKRLIKDEGVEDKDFKKQMIWHISNAKNKGLNPIGYLEKELSFEKDKELIYKIYAKYEAELKTTNCLDFDDLLLKTLELFQEHSDVLNYYQNKFEFIHIDEFQDTNVVQYEIVKLLAGKYKNIFAVGDEDQCIYTWRGANIENIKNFIKDFENCKVYKLEQNYRSTKSIIEKANALIKNNSSRIEKTLFTENEEGEAVTYYSAYDENDEAEYVVRTISTLISSGVCSKDIGVLMRISAMSRLIEEKLLNYNVPYIVSGIFKFFERLEIKDLLAYLRLIVNPKDNSSLLRIINVPKRSVGQASVDKLIEIARTQGVSLYDIIINYHNLDITNALKAKLMDFASILNTLAESYKTMPLCEFVKEMIKVTGIEKMYDTKNEEDLDRKLNIEQFVQSVQSFENLNDGGLVEYLESVTLQNSIEELDENKSGVSVSTVHASKGLEFNYVFIVGAEEGCFPLNRALDNTDDMEEERRLMYVAVTRAKRKLYIVRAKSRFLYGERKDTIESRFVKEMGLSKKEDVFYNLKSGFSQNKYSNYGNNSYIGDHYNQKTEQNFTLKSENSTFGSVWDTKLAKANDKANEYKVGVKVLHTKFGIGEITKIENMGETTFVSVNFNGIGVKTLSLAFAPLKIIK